MGDAVDNYLRLNPVASLLGLPFSLSRLRRNYNLLFFFHSRMIVFRDLPPVQLLHHIKDRRISVYPVSQALAASWKYSLM